jgi:hypothetical protein
MSPIGANETELATFFLGFGLCSFSVSQIKEADYSFRIYLLLSPAKTILFETK